MSSIESAVQSILSERERRDTPYPRSYTASPTSPFYTQNDDLVRESNIKDNFDIIEGLDALPTVQETFSPVSSIDYTENIADDATTNNTFFIPTPTPQSFTQQIDSWSPRENVSTRAQHLDVVDGLQELPTVEEILTPINQSLTMERAINTQNNNVPLPVSTLKSPYRTNTSSTLQGPSNHVPMSVVSNPYRSIHTPYRSSESNTNLPIVYSGNGWSSVNTQQSPTGRSGYRQQYTPRSPIQSVIPANALNKMPSPHDSVLQQPGIMEELYRSFKYSIPKGQLLNFFNKVGEPLNVAQDTINLAFEMTMATVDNPNVENRLYPEPNGNILWVQSASREQQNTRRTAYSVSSWETSRGIERSISIPLKFLKFVTHVIQLERQSNRIFSARHSI